MARARALPGAEVIHAHGTFALALAWFAASSPASDAEPRRTNRSHTNVRYRGPRGPTMVPLVKNWIALVACALASCAYVEATRVNYVGVPRYAPVKPEQVQVLPNEPKQRHERLGEIVLDISVDPPAPVEDIEARLREEGAQMGANAVYVIRDVARPGEARKLVGIAVRYQP